MTARNPPSGLSVERDVAAMAAGNVAGDGKAEAGAAGVEIARLVQPHERLEHVLARFSAECPGRRRRW